MKKRNVRHSRPPRPLRSAPRQVHLSLSGRVAVALAGALVAGSIGIGTSMYRRAQLSDQQVALFKSEAVAATGLVQTVRHHGDDNQRTTVHYTFRAGDANYVGAASVRRVDRDRYAAGSRASIWYLPSDPRRSWLDGYPPSRRSKWGAFAVPAAAILAAWVLAAVIHRQRHLLTYGRAATALVKEVAQKRTDKGYQWRVKYEWAVLSGATRKGRYTHGGNTPPAIGAAIPLVYDPDNPSRHSRYPLSLVTVPD